MSVFHVDTEAKHGKAVCFSNGIFNPAARGRLKLQCYKQKETKPSSASSSKHFVTAEIDDVTYVGTNFGSGNRFATNYYDYYLGIPDKKTGKIRVIPAHLFQLDPHIKDKQPSDLLDFNKETHKEKIDDLAMNFGSGRSQRAVKKREANKMSEDVVAITTKTVVESVHTQEQLATLAEEPAKTENSSVPPYDMDAKKPDDVYKLKDIIPPELLDSLTQISQTFFHCTSEDIAKWRQEKKYLSFILDKLEVLSLQEQARLLQSHCLMYLQMLMQVFLYKAHQLRSKRPLPQSWPIPVRDHILKLFSLEIKEPGKKYVRCVPARMKDLLLSHILVLCLKLTQFNLKLNPLMQDLKLSQKRLTTHATILGCTIKKTKGTLGSDVCTAILTVPLKFPEIKGKVIKNRIF